MYTGTILKNRRSPIMNESTRPPTSTRCQQIVGALYLLALLALVIFICL